MVKHYRRRYTRNSDMKGYRSKTQTIAHNEAKKVVKRTMSKAIEKKRFDGQIGFTSVDNSTGLIESLFTDPNGSNMNEGTGAQNTLGDVISPTSVRVRLAISINDLDQATTQPAIMRCLIIQAHGTAPALALVDILQSNFDFVLSEYTQSAVTSSGSGSRYKILADRTYVLNPYGGHGGLQYYNIHISQKKLRKVHFDASTPDSIQDGNIFILFVSDIPAGPTAPAVKYYSVVNFTDA